MRLTIIAATGGIGQQILEQALTGGHEVMAVVRDPAKLSRPVNAIAVDLGAPVHGLLEKAVQGADAVLSGLGPRSSADAGIASRGTRAMIDAMHVTGARRLVVVSAAPIGTVASPARPKPPKHDPGDGFFTRHLFGPMTKGALRKQYADLAIMEDIRETATTHQQAVDRAIPDGAQPEPSRRHVSLPRGRRSTHASPVAPGRHDQGSDRRRELNVECAAR